MRMREATGPRRFEQILEGRGGGGVGQEEHRAKMIRSKDYAYPREPTWTYYDQRRCVQHMGSGYRVSDGGNQFKLFASSI